MQPAALQGHICTEMDGRFQAPELQTRWIVTLDMRPVRVYALAAVL